MSARLSFAGASLIVAVLMGTPDPSRAQVTRGSIGQQPAEQGGADVRKSNADEVALRYYASLNQTVRVEAETRRLKRLHPGWEPPSDLWTSKPGNPDDGPLWELFAADKIDELRAAIKAHQAKDRNWVLSTDLEQKLRRKELRASIAAATRSRRWSEVAGVANNWRSDIDTGDVEVLWQIAEGYARSRRAADSLQVLQSILGTSSDPGERTATIHKALALLPMTDAERLIQMGKTDLSGKSEFDGIAIDITRARISALLHDTPGNDISAPELARFQDYAVAASDPNQPALLAWYALKRADLREALEHFKSSISKGGDATVAHGLAHTLRKLGRLREAEEVAYAWREPSPANAILFIDILAEQLTQGSASFDPKRLARYAEVTLQSASGEGAQALAWYAYNSCQLDVAAEWFKRAISWFPKEPTAIGYALTLRRLKRNQEFLDIVNRYDGLFPTVVSLLFPDGLAKSDDPCDRKTVKTASSRSDNGGLNFGQLPQQQYSARATPRTTSWSTVPMPSKIGLEKTLKYAGPKSTEFPIAVAAENPYRSQSGDRTLNPKGVADSWRPPAPVIPVTQARRVPGVGPMPYERYGKTLLPGWNGTLQPALSAAALLRSPNGTQWSTEQIAFEVSQQSNVGKSASVASSAAASTVDAAARFHP